jgi:cytochrome P450
VGDTDARVAVFSDIERLGIDLVDELESIFLNDSGDPYRTYRELRTQGGIWEGDAAVERCGVPFRMLLADRPAFSIVGYDAAISVLRDFENFSNTVYQATIGQSMGVGMSMLDAPEHTRLRRTFQAQFTKLFVSRLRGQVAEPLVDTYFLPKLRGQGHSDLIRDLAFEFPVMTIHSMLGLPRETVVELNAIAVGMLLVKTRPDIGLACGRRLEEIINREFEARLERPGTDLISELIVAAVKPDSQISREELLHFLRILLPAGGETTTKAIGSTFTALLSDEEQLDLVLSDRSNVPLAIEEALRWESPDQFIWRVAVNDVEVEGVRIPAGSGIVVCLGSANHDDERFPDPEHFDLRRSKTRTHQLAFSHGPHTCLGMNIARMEVEVAINRLLDQLPNLRLDPDAAPPVIRGSAFRSPTAVNVIWD